MVEITILKAGYCTHPEVMVLPGGSWKSMVFPASYALIRHPVGWILFDTGYSERFYQETQTLPNKLYALLTPVYLQSQDSALAQLEQLGIKPQDIKYIIISHFHADHIGGLKDFPQAKFLCSQLGYNTIKNKRGFFALKAGFLPGLMPDNFENQVVFIESNQIINLPENFKPFERGFDLFNDGSLVAVELPGHAVGQMGLYLTDNSGKQYFLIADACWLNRSYQELIYPQRIADILFADKTAYRETLKKIHQLYRNNPDVKIIPSHSSIALLE